MKKIILMCSALLLLTGCAGFNTTSLSPEEEAEQRQAYQDSYGFCENFEDLYKSKTVPLVGKELNSLQLKGCYGLKGFTVSQRLDAKTFIVEFWVERPDPYGNIFGKKGKILLTFGIPQNFVDGQLVSNNYTIQYDGVFEYTTVLGAKASLHSFRGKYLLPN